MARAIPAIVVHLVLCLLIVFLGLVAAGLAENVTATERQEIDRDAILTLVMLGLAITWSVLLCFRRRTIAVAAFAVECVLGVVVLPPWLATSVKYHWFVWAVAATFVLSGCVALAALRPDGLRSRPSTIG